MDTHTETTERRIENGTYITKKLCNAFPKSFINGNLEFIAHQRANEYFRLEDCENEFDVKCKVLEYLSRGGYKTQPYHTKKSNDAFNEFMLNGINKFLKTNFSKDDMAIIYQKLGNGVNPELTVAFIVSGYNISILKKGEKNHE